MGQSDGQRGIGQTGVKRLLAGRLARQIHIRSFARIGLGASD